MYIYKHCGPQQPDDILMLKDLLLPRFRAIFKEALQTPERREESGRASSCF